MSSVVRNLRAALQSHLLYACLFLSLLAWTLAWQVKQVYLIDVGGLTDDAFVSGFNAKERNPDLNYRWSEANSSITLAGIGNEPYEVTLRIAGGRPAQLNLPAPEIQIGAGAQSYTRQTQNGLSEFTVATGGGGDWHGNLVISIQSPTFPDPPTATIHRDLGVTVDKIEVRPAEYGLRPFVIPPPDHLAFWAVSLTLVFLIATILIGNPRGAALISALLSLTLTGLIIWKRLEVGLLAAQAPVLLLWCLLFAVVGLALGNWLLKIAGAKANRAGAAVAGAFVVAFLIRLGGLTYPQYLNTDTTFHVHNIERILRGDWLWKSWASALPDGTPVPYPYGLYALLAPFAGLVPDLSLLLRFAVGVIDAATVFPLFYMALLLFRSPRAGAWAAWFYALLAAALLLFSPGNYSNLFAEFTFTLALAFLVRLLARKKASWGAWVGLGLALLLTFLSHYGMLVAAGVVAGFVLLAALLFGDALLRRRVLGAAGVGLLALLVAFVAFYQPFVPVITAQVQASLDKLTGGGSGGVGANFASGVMRYVGLGIGGLPLLAGLFGWGLAPADKHLRRLLPLFAAAYFLADLVVALLTVTAGDNTRYVLLLAPFIALGAGGFSARLSRFPVGVIFVFVLAALALWLMINTWLGLIMFQYHDSWPT